MGVSTYRLADWHVEGSAGLMTEQLQQDVLTDL